MTKIKTKVSIGNVEYTLSGYESEEYIHKVAIFVDKKIKSTKMSSENLSTTLLATLTAINIADELLKEKNKTAILEKALDKLTNGYTTINKNSCLLPFDINL